MSTLAIICLAALLSGSTFIFNIGDNSEADVNTNDDSVLEVSTEKDMPKND